MASETVSSHPEGVVIDVWVIPGASRQGVDGFHDGAVRVRTTAPPEDGKANRAVEAIAARVVGAGRAEVIAGHGSRRKRVLIRGVDLEAVRAAFGL